MPLCCTGATDSFPEWIHGEFSCANSPASTVSARAFHIKNNNNNAQANIWINRPWHHWRKQLEGLTSPPVGNVPLCPQKNYRLLFQSNNTGRSQFFRFLCSNINNGMRSSSLDWHFRCWPLNCHSHTVTSTPVAGLTCSLILQLELD